jgi:uncharacterized protein RhaS with RHS repeats
MTGLAAWNVQGPVHSLRTEFAEWDLTLEQWQPAQSYSIVRFRPDGALGESEHHNPDGTTSRSSSIYDAAGRIQETRFSMNDGPAGKSLYFYDERGRLTRMVGVDPDGTEREVEAYTYGQDGKRTKIYFVPNHLANSFMYSIEGTVQSYGAPGALTNTTLHDDGGRPDEVLFHDADQRLLRRVVLMRDGTGRLITEEMHLGEESPFPAILFGPNSVLSSTSYAYDAKGRILERRTRMGELGEHRTTFRYDDRDNPAEETNEDMSREMQIDEAGVLHTAKETSSVQHVRFEYMYDPQGNWLERVVWSRLEPNPNFERSNITRREITYYD